jgi:hypothetical protein
MKKIFISLFLFLLVGLVFGMAVPLALAATVTTIVSQKSISVGQEVVAEVTIDTAELINTVDLLIVIPAQFDVTRMTDAGSIISLWIEKPTFDSQTHTIHLSGLVPVVMPAEEEKLLRLL